MTITNAVSVLKRGIMLRSLRAQLLKDLGIAGAVLVVLASVDRLAPLVGTPWTAILVSSGMVLVARLVVQARQSNLDRASALLLADEALGSPETLVTSDELANDDSAAAEQVHQSAKKLLSAPGNRARLSRLGPGWPSASLVRLALPFLAWGILQLPERSTEVSAAAKENTPTITPVKAVAEVVEEAIETAEAFGQEDAALAKELADSLAEAAASEDPMRQAEAMDEARRKLDERLGSLQAEADALEDRLADLNPKIDPAASLREALQEGNEAKAEAAAAELDAQLSEALAKGDDAKADAIKKALTNLASDLSDLASQPNDVTNLDSEASSEMLEAMAKATAGDQKAQERLQQMAEMMKNAGECQDGQCSGDATALMKQLAQAMKEGQAMQSACGSMSAEDAMSALACMGQGQGQGLGAGNTGQGPSQGGAPGSEQESDTDVSFERLAGDPSEGEVLLRMKERRAGPVGKSTMDPVEARRVALAGWEAALEQEVTDPRHREALRRYHERLIGKSPE